MKGDQSILRGRAKGASAGFGMFLMLSVYHVPTALSMRRAYLSNPLPNRYVTALLLQQVSDFTKYALNVFVHFVQVRIREEKKSRTRRTSSILKLPTSVKIFS